MTKLAIYKPASIISKIVLLIFGTMICASCTNVTASDETRSEGDQTKITQDLSDTSASDQSSNSALGTKPTGTAASFFDLDGDGQEDSASIVRNSGPIKDAMSPVNDDGQQASETGDRIVVQFGDGRKAVMFFPFVQKIYPLYKGAQYPDEAVICWPVNANQALFATAEEGQMVYYLNGDELIGDACTL